MVFALAALLAGIILDTIPINMEIPIATDAVNRLGIIAICIK